MKNLLLAFFTLLFFNTGFSQDWEELNFDFGEFGFGSNPKISVSHNNAQIAAFFKYEYFSPVQISTDQGESWSASFDNSVIELGFDDAGNAFALEHVKIGIWANGGLYHSNNSGQTWNELTDIPDYVDQVGYTVTDEGRVVFGTQTGMKYSDDQGNSWTEVSTPNTHYGYLKTSTGRIIITTYNNGIHYSDDNGGSWSQATGDLGNITFGFLQEHPTNGKIYVSSGGGVLESNDNGESFYLITPDPWIAMNIRKFEISKAGNFYFYGLYGVYESTDAITWNLISEGLPAETMYDMSMSDNYIYVAVGSKIYRKAITTGSSSVSSRDENILKTKIFPNPASELARLTFNISRTAELVVEISDINAHLILTEKYIVSKTGFNQITLNTTDLPEGLYLVTVRTSTTSQTQRLVIIK